MPIYEYACQKCQHVTEALRAMRDADEPLACEKCGSLKSKRMQSTVSVNTESSGGDMPLPMGGCGRCGDPNGPCGL